MRLGFRIATRFLKSNLGQTFLIVLGIAIGVSVQIFIGSLIQGLQKGLVEKTIGNSSQITITSEEESKKIEEYESIMTRVRDTDDRIEDISPVADFPAFLELDDNSQSLLVRGLDPKKADGIYDIYDRITEGTFPKQEDEILLGTGLQEEYALHINDEITLITTQQKKKTFKVTGFFDFKVASINDSWGIMNLAPAQQFFEAGNSITSIEIQLKEDSVFLADEIAANIAGTLKQNNLTVENWKVQNEQLLSGLQGQSISSIMIQVFVMISVVLGIASVLAITVMQKSKQIGILKAMGIRNASTSYIFLFEGLLLGIAGALLGILFGLGLSVAFTKFALNPDGTPVVDLYISYSFILLSGTIAVAASILAALIPAIRSSKLNPIDIIRNN